PALLPRRQPRDARGGDGAARAAHPYACHPAHRRRAAPAAPELRVPRRHEPAARGRAAVAVTTLACLGSGREVLVSPPTIAHRGSRACAAPRCGWRASYLPLEPHWDCAACP